MTTPRYVVLTFHSLDDSGSVISVPPERFRRQMEFLASSSFPVVPLDEIFCRPNCVAITFDDGFCNFLDQAAPVLESLRLPATIFVVSEHCGGRNNWRNQPSGVPDLPLMSWQDLASLPPSISVGAHTKTHSELAALSEVECESELHDCKDQIEQHLGQRIRCLAYPYGSSTPQVMSIAQRHFELAVGTSLRYLSSRADVFDLPRIDAYYLRGRFSVEHLFQPYGECYIGFRQVLRQVRRGFLA